MKKSLLVFLMITLFVWGNGVIGAPNKSGDGGITVVSGDYSEGQITLYNPLKATYSRAILRQISIYDAEGKLVSGINVSIIPKVIDNWKGSAPLNFRYLVNCSGPVPPGNYTITLKFIGVLSDGDVNVFRVFIPLKVLGSPIVVEGVEVYPNGSTVFINDTLVGYIRILNIGHKNISASFSFMMKKGDKTYYSSFQDILLHPGELKVGVEVPITSEFDDGSYDAIFTVRSRYGEYVIKRQITISTGVEVFSLSLDREAVYPDEELNLYLSLLSSRDALLSVSVKVSKDGTVVWHNSSKIYVESGMKVVNIKLPTKEPGNYTVDIAVSAFNVTVGKSVASYTVWSLPTIEGIVPSLSGENVSFYVKISNSGPEERGVLSYTITLDDHIFYSGSKIVEIPHGESNISLRFPLSVSSGGNLSYTFVLNVRGHASKYAGEYMIFVPKSTESSTSPTSTTSNVINNETGQPSSTSIGTTSPSGSGINSGTVVLGIVLLLAVVGLWVAESHNRKAKRRSRPKPKRRSPLGRFKRPKPPKFGGLNSLPRRK